MSRRLSLCLTFMLLTVLAPACMAAHYTFSNGHIRLSVPDGWPRILQSPGDPETMVFQVPDAAPISHDALARVTVTSEQVSNLAGFQHFVSESTNRARALPQFKADPQRSTATELYYTANEGAVAQTYVEHYTFHNGYGVLVRCVRPSHSQAGAAWTATFDKGCASMAASVE